MTRNKLALSGSSIRITSSDLTIDKEDLAEFVDKFDHLNSLRHTDLAIAFGYYLQTNVELDSFCTSDIAKCYSILDVPVPTNFSDILGKAVDKKRLVRKGKCFRLSKDEFETIRNIVVPKLLSDTRFEKVYEPGDIYNLYIDIKTLVANAKSSILIIDPWANEDVIDLYLRDIQPGIRVSILTDRYQGNFLSVAKHFRTTYGTNFTVRTNDRCHDRLIFIDKSCYVIGQSIDKAARDKPTYMIRILNNGPFRKEFQKLFDQGTPLL